MLGGLAGADAICAARANAAGLPGTFKAFLGSLNANAWARLAGARGFARVDGKPFGDTVADDVRVSIYADGQKLPLSASFDKIEAGDEAVQTKYVTFERAGHHQLRVVLDEDSLSEDNQAHLAVEIPPSNPVLIIASDINGDSPFVVSSKS